MTNIYLFNPRSLSVFLKTKEFNWFSLAVHYMYAVPVYLYFVHTHACIHVFYFNDIIFCCFIMYMLHPTQDMLVLYIGQVLLNVHRAFCYPWYTGLCFEWICIILRYNFYEFLKNLCLAYTPILCWKHFSFILSSEFISFIVRRPPRILEVLRASDLMGVVDEH